MQVKRPIKPYINHQAGFTLIEIIIGIVVLSIAFLILTNLIYPLANRSAEQVHQIRAAELGQSMINEIYAKAYDEYPNISGGYYRCGEDRNNNGGIEDETAGANTRETCSIVMGSEAGETRATFDDVDDYNGLTTIESSLGSSDDLTDLYTGYSISVQVITDSNYDGISDGSDNNYTAKLITVTVKSPQDSNFTFSVYRTNF